jgi:hypothetical protein
MPCFGGFPNLEPTSVNKPRFDPRPEIQVI